MRKKIIGIVIMLLCTIMTFTACNFASSQESNNGKIESDDVFATHSGEVLNKRYSTVKHSTSTASDLIDSYYDDNYYYYYFYLGEVNDVPLQSNLEAGYYHYTGNNYTKAFKTTRTTTKSVEDACSTAVTNTTTLSETDNLKAGITAKLSTKTKISSGFASEELSAEISSNIETGYSKTTGKNTSTSRTDSYKEVVSYSETTEETTGFEFTSESKIGYYRYIMTGSLDVYTVAIYSIADEIFYLETLTEVMSRGYSFDFSESSRFNDSPCGILEFDCSILNDLLSHIPDKPLFGSSGGSIPPEIGDLPGEGLSGSIVAAKSSIYNSTESFPVFSAVESYGLLYVNYETIDLSDYRNYFNKNYMFCFTVTLNLSNNNSNCQEIFLYSNNKTASEAVEISTAISSYGLVRGSSITHRTGAYNHYITWNVRGDEIKDNMYIRYDASGSNFLFNAWTKNSISVGLTVISESKDLPSEQTVLNNSNSITVTDDGIYGLAARSHEQIHLSDYSEYMSSDYIFIFDVTINMNEKDDGYQEIYLYNKYDVTTSSTSKDISYAREHGLVYGTQIEHDPGKANTKPQDHNFNWVITGNNICDTMYIRYDAHGKDDDTWYKNSIKITLKIFYAPDLEVDSSVSDVFT